MRNRDRRDFLKRGSLLAGAAGALASAAAAPAAAQTGGVATHCDIGGVTTPTAPGDFVGAVIYSINAINPGQSKTVKVLYRRF